MMAASYRLQILRVGLVLLMAGVLLIITTRQGPPSLGLVTRKQGAAYIREVRSCHQHIHLCWLRHVLTAVFNQTMSDDVYDMTNLYKFQTHIFLDDPEYNNTAVRGYPSAPQQDAAGKRVIQYTKDEAFINGYQRPVLKLDFGVDVDGRDCSYDPFLHYAYTYKLSQTRDRALVYVTETSIGQQAVNSVPNYIKGLVKTKLTVSACMNIDYFINGTYLFGCPILGDNPRITVQATYISIAKSNFRCNVSVHKPIYYLKEFLVKQKHQSNISQSVKSKCTSGRGHERGFWLKVGTVSHWATNHCYYPYHFADRQLKCLSSKSVIMFGDSHTQRRCGMCLKKAYKLNHLVQHQTPNALALLVDLLNVYKRCINGQCADVLVANVAHHDLREYDIIAYIAGMNDVFKMIKQFKELNRPPQIIWIETTPVTENGFHGGMMANQAVEAVNHWVNHQMEQLGVDIVYAYNLAITMTSHTYDGSHYPCFLGRHVHDKIPVNVGGAVVSVMVNTICPLS